MKEYNPDIVLKHKLCPGIMTSESEIPNWNRSSWNVSGKYERMT
jgi:hypothetical protein